MQHTVTINKEDFYGKPVVFLSQSNGDESIALTLDDAREVAARILFLCDLQENMKADISVDDIYQEKV